ncbi:MAG TPA: VOC family protein [Pyrinomonadaceae bacterium]|nr:VOC family protein [Pyrinomonadaceae bacterium]
MKPPPAGWPRIVSAVYYDDAGAAIDWLCRAFGFEVRVKIEGEGGRIEHSELMHGEGMVMVGQAGKESFRQSPRSTGGANTQNMMLFVDDADAHCEHARANGARIVKEPITTDYGADWWTDRGYECEDLEGHHWWFYQRLREQTIKE